MTTVKSTFNSILNRICNVLFGDSRDKTLYFLDKLDKALQEKYSESGTFYFSLITLENSGGGEVTVNHSHFYQEEGEWLKENAKVNLLKSELPNYLRIKLASALGEVDITEDIEQEIDKRKFAE